MVMKCTTQPRTNEILLLHTKNTRRNECGARGYLKKNEKSVKNGKSRSNKKNLKNLKND